MVKTNIVYYSLIELIIRIIMMSVNDLLLCRLVYIFGRRRMSRATIQYSVTLG